MRPVSRRRFLQCGASSAAALLGSNEMLRCAAASIRADQAKGEGGQADGLPMVQLGETGRSLPRLGLGGYPIVRQPTDEAGAAVVRRAIELGVRYLDTAPSYGDGTSERRIGLAIRDVDRDSLYIATKTLERSADGARRELERSLELLGTEYVDSVQVHEVHDDVGRIFEKGAVVKALEKARDEGLIRHIGVTVHRNPRYALAALERYPFATALVPVNPLDVQHLSFIRELLPVAKSKGVGVIAMKVYAGGGLLKARSGPLTVEECLGYALSQDGVAIAIPGCQTVSHVEEAFAAVRDFEPQSDDVQREMEKKVGEHQGRSSEWYKEGRPTAE